MDRTCNRLVHVFSQRASQRRHVKRLCIIPFGPELHPLPAGAQPQAPALEVRSEAAAVHRFVGALYHKLEQPKVAGRNAQHTAEQLWFLLKRCYVC
jgi:hypothetical protein